MKDTFKRFSSVFDTAIWFSLFPISLFLNKVFALGASKLLVLSMFLSAVLAFLRYVHPKKVIIGFSLSFSPIFFYCIYLAFFMGGSQETEGAWRLGLMGIPFCLILLCAVGVGWVLGSGLHLIGIKHKELKYILGCGLIVTGIVILYLKYMG